MLAKGGDKSHASALDNAVLMALSFGQEREMGARIDLGRRKKFNKALVR